MIIVKATMLNKTIVVKILFTNPLLTSDIEAESYILYPHSPSFLFTLNHLTRVKKEVGVLKCN